MEPAAWTSDSAIVTHAHHNNASIDSQLRSWRLIHFSHSCHNGFCLGYTVFGRLWDERKYSVSHVIIVLHGSKVESDSQEWWVGWHKKQSPMKDWEDNEVTTSSIVSGPVNLVVRICVISMSAWEVTSPLVLHRRTIVPNCILEMHIVVCHGHWAICIIKVQFGTLQSVFYEHRSPLITLLLLLC